VPQSEAPDNKRTDLDPSQKTADATITVHVEVSAEGMTKLPTGSTIRIKGDEKSCKNLEQEQSLNSDRATFSSLPICKVKLKIYITGFDGKVLSVDLAKYKDPMKILVKSAGVPVVN